MLFLNKQISAIAFFNSIGSLKSNEIEQLKGLQKKMEDRENLSIEDKKLYIELSAHFTSLVYREIAIEEQRAQRKEAIVENFAIRREA